MFENMKTINRTPDKIVEQVATLVYSDITETDVDDIVISLALWFNVPTSYVLDVVATSTNFKTIHSGVVDEVLTQLKTGEVRREAPRTEFRVEELDTETTPLFDEAEADKFFSVSDLDRKFSSWVHETGTYFALWNWRDRKVRRAKAAYRFYKYNGKEYAKDGYIKFKLWTAATSKECNRQFWIWFDRNFRNSKS